MLNLKKLKWIFIMRPYLILKLQFTYGKIWKIHSRVLLSVMDCIYLSALLADKAKKENNREDYNYYYAMGLRKHELLKQDFIDACKWEE